MVLGWIIGRICGGIERRNLGLSKLYSRDTREGKLQPKQQQLGQNHTRQPLNREKIKCIIGREHEKNDLAIIVPTKEGILSFCIYFPNLQNGISDLLETRRDVQKIGNEFSISSYT